MNDAFIKLRKKSLQLSHLAHDGNLQSVFSSMEIIWTLYDKILDLDKIRKNDNNRDLFVLSKGQSTLGLLCVLEEKGFLDYEELKGICKFDSRFSMQSDRTKFDRAIEISAGSLGHGFPMAVGMAMANKILKFDSNVYCLAGDGEFNEGTMWEACLLAADKKLDNLYVIIDDNQSINQMINVNNWIEKLKAFGFHSIEVNGHSVKEIENAISRLQEVKNVPKAIVAKTKRGFGSKTLMDQNEWFHKSPNEVELGILIQEVESFEKNNG